jgi:hypothetical protein
LRQQIGRDPGGALQGGGHEGQASNERKDGQRCRGQGGTSFREIRISQKEKPGIAVGVVVQLFRFGAKAAGKYSSTDFADLHRYSGAKFRICEGIRGLEIGGLNSRFRFARRSEEAEILD